MYKILKAEKLSENIFLMDVHAPRVASHCEPGQFVIVKMDPSLSVVPEVQAVLQDGRAELNGSLICH